ncbi:MAG: imidazole glycerol phosphate synthase subunit HisF [Candidatus Harrisonbacteria bacterium RIFCSPLOWO2_02_FULL_41_11]|uniref:imidazole glycerol-phosphate synthase n=1 Tax=Candidatus Harrisonbacteria bacterium RIFCSPHIGHO2_02_FULL_42_16 TaxID=1798404 RepID=A0A1G1ZG99_9BACT|nr:MAG: imidazole glycerol phosphate synthase subunit HisF [Candidatus Harrisonbacteria bacterium RIFCSPHIGHO2_02_FULL_42_16]OGY65653.1 MAG: imidazole glycerol phosphate synthase subunit HisF [Candidatus Harrisonbacteria bacterium RIFCSPLOWO2_02_FULL_41_11]
MKNIRIMPRLDIKGPNVVKPVHTEALHVVGDPKELAQRYYQQGADEIIYMDIVASLYGRNLDFDLLRSVTENIFVPVTVGGGIRTIHDINNALRAGADKVAINTYAIHRPEFISEAAKEFGSQCIVLSIEAKKQSDGFWEAYTDGGRESSGLDAIEWAKRGLELGAGELMITSIDQDGTGRGYDLDLIKKITSFVSVPVIVYGGAGNQESFLKVINDGGADAVAAASVFHYRNLSIPGVKKFLKINGINVRT